MGKDRDLLKGHRLLMPVRYPYTLDYIDDLQVDLEGHAEFEPFQVSHLRNLHAGLDFLSALVQEKQLQIEDSSPNWPDEDTVRLMTCVFSWYSVAACDYVRTVGRLAFEDDKRKTLKYLNKVIPNVYHWRRKVGAHATFVTLPIKGPVELIDRQEIDKSNEEFINDAKENLYSYSFFAPMVHFSYSEKIFRAGTNLGVPLPSGELHVEDLTWSLTRVHRELTDRYWPEIRLHHC